MAKDLIKMRILSGGTYPGLFDWALNAKHMYPPKTEGGGDSSLDT